MFFGTLFYENKDLILKYDFIIRETGTGQGRIQTSLHSLWGIVGTSNCGIGRRYLSKKFLFILFYYVAWKLTYQLKWLRVHCTLLDIEQNFYTSPPLPPQEFTFIYPPPFLRDCTGKVKGSKETETWESQTLNDTYKTSIWCSCLEKLI